MRKSIFSLVAVLAIPFAFTGCGEESTSSNDNPTPSNPQSLAQLGSMATSYKGMADGYLQMAQGLATGFASGFAPSAKRSAETTCKLNQTITEEGVTTIIKVTTADGKTLLTTCEQANAAYSSASGIGIQMKMTTTQGGMAIVMNMMMAYKPVGTAGGYNAVMDLDVTMTGNAQGQNVSIGIGPIHIVANAANADAEPVIDGYMTFSMPPYTIEKVSFDANGLKAGSYNVKENGSVVAKFVVDANGDAVVQDLQGKPIQG
jgi:hypothetical protein